MFKQIAACDGCGEENRELPGSRTEYSADYSEIVSTGEAQINELDGGWAAKHYPNPEDPIAVRLDLLCPDCR